MTKQLTPYEYLNIPVDADQETILAAFAKRAFEQCENSVKTLPFVIDPIPAMFAHQINPLVENYLTLILDKELTILVSMTRQALSTTLTDINSIHQMLSSRIGLYFRHQSLRFHPDKNQTLHSSEDKFIALNNNKDIILKSLSTLLNLNKEQIDQQLLETEAAIQNNIIALEHVKTLVDFWYINMCELPNILLKTFATREFNTQYFRDTSLPSIETFTAYYFSAYSGFSQFFLDLLVVKPFYIINSLLSLSTTGVGLLFQVLITIWKTLAYPFSTETADSLPLYYTYIDLALQLSKFIMHALSPLIAVVLIVGRLFTQEEKLTEEHAQGMAFTPTPSIKVESTQRFFSQQLLLEDTPQASVALLS